MTAQSPNPITAYAHVPAYVSVARLAYEFEVSESTIWNWVRAGKLPKPHKIQGSTRWSWEAVRKLIDGEDAPAHNDPHESDDDEDPILKASRGGKD